MNAVKNIRAMGLADTLGLSDLVIICVGHKKPSLE